jgi:hypothetical protein
VQLIAAPPSFIVHVSDSVEPVMPKLAVATVGAVTESGADFVSPPYEAVMVLPTVLVTTRVATEKVAVVAPVSTVTLETTVTGPLPASETLAPPAGAGPDKVTAPLSVSPPRMVPVVRVTDTSVARAVTVSAGDCMVLVPIVAVTAADPGPTALKVKVALDDPAGMFSVAGTVATAALLLASVTMAPAAGAAALSVTVPCPVVPAMTLADVSVTDATAVVELGDVVEPPHCAVLRRPKTAATSVNDESNCLLTCFMPR